MRTLHGYLLRQVLASLVMTMLVFTFVLLVGSALRELLPLLVNGQASFAMVAKAFGLLIPFVFAFALPTAILTSTLLVFGRFSADQELTAARASGISLVSLAAPVLVLGLLLCGLSALINMQFAPTCRVAYNDLRADMRTALANFRLPEGQPVEFPGQTNGASYTVYARKNRNQNLQDVMILKIEQETNRTTIIAPGGRMEMDTNDQKLVLNLTNFDAQLPDGHSFSGAEWLVPIDLKASEKNAVGITDMTFQQLREQLKKSRVSAPIPLNTVQTADLKKRKLRLQKFAGDFSEPIRIQIHKQVAFSFACFGFTLIGIPLGIRVHRRETNIGILVAVALVLIYYTIQFIGQSLSSHAEYAPHLLMWMPNLVFQATGAVLLWRANRGI
ncbi:MAG TPA: LptF/LptG family permease [Verrucomicrobiae bacterium]